LQVGLNGLESKTTNGAISLITKWFIIMLGSGWLTSKNRMRTLPRYSLTTAELCGFSGIITATNSASCFRCFFLRLNIVNPRSKNRFRNSASASTCPFEYSIHNKPCSSFSAYNNTLFKIALSTATVLCYRGGRKNTLALEFP